MKKVIINSRKYDGKIHRTWEAELIRETKFYYSFVGTFQKEIEHQHLGFIRRGTISYEFYWKNEWFNVFRFHEPEGDLRNFYCNINKPPKLQNGILDYIDLDIDVLVWKDFSYKILDTDEFEENSKIYEYSDKLKKRVMKSLDEVLELVKNRHFPFRELEDTK